MEKLKNNSGITLVTLIITIVVILILAGISIAAITGDNGLITQSKAIQSNIEKAEKEGQQIINSMQPAEYTEDGTKNLTDSDTKAPTINSINVTDITSTSFKVTVNVTETGSGIEKIEYSIDDGNTYVTANDKLAKSYIFTGLDVGFEEYKVKVKVTDVNNNVSYGIKTIEKLKVGDYVNYTYDKAEEYVLKSETCGSSDNIPTGIPQTPGLQWRILSINDDKSLDLISDTPTNVSIYFNGALGYNNSVYLINDICEKQYSNKTLGVTARSIKIEDIEAQMNDTGITARDTYSNSDSEIQYGKTKTYTGINSYYPNLYAQENGSGINTTNVKKNGIGRSENYYTTPTTKTYSPESTTDTSKLTVTQNYYSFYDTPESYFNDSNFHLMIFGTNSFYWLASRYANCESNCASFGLRRVIYSSLFGSAMFSSNKETVRNSYPLRPVASIKLSNIDFNLGKDADGHWNIK